MLVVVDWLFVVSSDAVCLDALYSEAVSSGTVSSGTSISRIGTYSLLDDVAISEFGVSCGGHSIITSSEAMLEAIYELDTYSGSSPE